MDQNPYAPPGADLDSDLSNVVYAGFWIRVAASMIDSILVMLITYPLLTSIYGKEYFESMNIIAGPMDILISWVFPAVAVITFWIYRSATPGKILVKIKIVDAKTGQKPSAGQLIGRYFGYFVSTIPFMLGIIWVGIDKRKQGWHDKLAGTVVVKITKQTDGKAVFVG
jgi:uncharacterized RDD family membrane protein YckC